jgi:hypothetical protein
MACRRRERRGLPAGAFEWLYLLSSILEFPLLAVRIHERLLLLSFYYTTHLQSHYRCDECTPVAQSFLIISRVLPNRENSLHGLQIGYISLASELTGQFLIAIYNRSTMNMSYAFGPQKLVAVTNRNSQTVLVARIDAYRDLSGPLIIAWCLRDSRCQVKLSFSSSKSFVVNFHPPSTANICQGRENHQSGPR